MYEKKFPDRLKELRKGKGLSMQTLADRVGVSKMSISQYESGRNYPTLEVAMKLADCLETSLDFLTGRSDYNDLKKPNS